ncbi:MAG: hypothetical protein CVV64_04040 [Candidatus Wallbacteria bacterium HGW-Wallbacteria-1]|uniref:Bacterial type II secretion system protein E domain-containing protein n=1 Tax=Candidatus Wallbacteria bacterium HGW-Wallbacteria-1 TaxID=2013854 RepID=A0A2N1PRH7_9BACT|nr:MAG: hypothetical protein CVV64_04040 [Candidatus Wallbacteria bacterium HGW-Wallbacteria-1]
MDDTIFRKVPLRDALIASGTVDSESLSKIESEISGSGKTLEQVLLKREILRPEQLEDILVSVIIKRDITEVLLSEGFVTQESLDALRSENSGKIPTKYPQQLIQKGFLSEADYARALAIEHGVEFIDLSEFDIEDELLGLVDVELMQRYNFIPFRKVDNKLVVVVSDPGDIQLLDELEYSTGFDIKIKVATASDIRRLLNLVLETSLDASIVFKDVDQLLDGESESRSEERVEKTARGLRNSQPSSVVGVIDALLYKAIVKRASDIHFEIYEDEVRVKYRIDGVLFKVMTMDATHSNLIISRIKVLANLDIAEKRVPQDGRFSIQFDDRDIDFRVSVLPSIHGETVVLRILDKAAVGLDINLLGFEDEDRHRFERNVRKPYGMILVAGPTGSGKTTTLYSAINMINTPQDKLITIEDPVEFQFDDIVQIAVNEKQGLSFAAGLRSIVRQDPDKIMVGEIRDTETAQIAVNAALTGHLVLSSIHANNVIDSISRLTNMGIDIYQFVSSFNLIVSQRLVRKICNHCKIVDEKAKKHIRSLVEDWDGHEEAEFFIGKGCRYCHRTGYSGRVGIYEVMAMTPSIKRLVLEGASPMIILDQALKEGMQTLRKATWKKVHEGITTIDEMNRVTFED